MSFTNPIEEIYKCSILIAGGGDGGDGNGGIPKSVYVFYGHLKGHQMKDDALPTSKQLTQLYRQYHDDGSNSEAFKNVFSKVELKNISKYKIKIHFVNFKI